MNVFVLCTGRCGSMTFKRACAHMTNYAVAHESHRHRHNPELGPAQRIANYPENHIEIDNRLSWMLGLLDKEYGDHAFYVHLIRNREETARSFLNRWHSRDGNIIFSYSWGILSYRYDQISHIHVVIHFCLRSQPMFGRQAAEVLLPKTAIRAAVSKPGQACKSLCICMLW